MTADHGWTVSGKEAPRSVRKEIFSAERTVVYPPSVRPNAARPQCAAIEFEGVNSGGSGEPGHGSTAPRLSTWARFLASVGGDVGSRFSAAAAWPATGPITSPARNGRRGVLAISWTFPLCCFWCPIVKLALVIRWAYLAEPTLFPDVIVISLDVVEHGGPDLSRVAPHVLIDQLLLDRRIKRFRCRVVIAYPGVPDRRDNTLGEKAIAVPSRGILGTAKLIQN